MLPKLHDLEFWCLKHGYTHSWNKDCRVREMCYPHKPHYGINIAFKIECSFHKLTLWVILGQWNFFPLEGFICIARHPQSMETSWEVFSAFLHFLVALSRVFIFHWMTLWRVFSERLPVFGGFWVHGHWSVLASHFDAYSNSSISLPFHWCENLRITLNVLR